MIEAEDELDAVYGFGFCQGQDRSAQIELMKRAASGTLSELFGRATLQVDRLFRRAGLRHAAEQQLHALSPYVRSTITAFAAGVNAGRTVGLPRRPHEFVLLRAQPTEFTPTDVFAILKLQSFAIPSNWDSELARLMVLNLDGPESLLDLDPSYPEWHGVAAPPTGVAGKAAERLAEDLAVFRETVGTGGGSNAWAISGRKTRSGHPLLANDPHLAPVAPPHWYLARVQSAGWTVAGAALPGTPAIAIGHNGNCAWGLTAGLTDNTDLFLERIGPDGRSVLEDGAYVSCETRREVIRVRGAKAVEEEVLVTSRGPIISPALHGELGAISMRAVWLDPLPLMGFMGAQDAETVEEFRAPFAEWPILPINLVFADTQGNIGYQLAGQAPRRRRGYGTVPGAGWDPRAGWQDEGVPFEEMPNSINPPCGYVASANTQPEPHGSGPYLGIDWIDGYRLGRITEALEERSDWDMESTAALHMDVKSLPWTEMRDAILAGTPGRKAPGLVRPRRILENWDGRMACDSEGATLFHLFQVEMSRRIAEARAPRSAPWLLGRSLHAVNRSSFFAARHAGRLSRLLRERPAGWFDDGWEVEVDDALRSAYLYAVDRLGESTARWRWGRVRTAKLAHPMSRVPLLGAIFDLGPFACPGDVNTVFQAGTFGDDPFSGPWSRPVSPHGPGRRRLGPVAILPARRAIG